TVPPPRARRLTAPDRPGPSRSTWLVSRRPFRIGRICRLDQVTGLRAETVTTAMPVQSCGHFEVTVGLGGGRNGGHRDGGKVNQVFGPLLQWLNCCGWA